METGEGRSVDTKHKVIEYNNIIRIRPG